MLKDVVKWIPPLFFILFSLVIVAFFMNSLTTGTTEFPSIYHEDLIIYQKEPITFCGILGVELGVAIIAFIDGVSRFQKIRRERRKQNQDSR